MTAFLRADTKKMRLKAKQKKLSKSQSATISSVSKYT